MASVKTILWVYRSFGFRAAILYVKDVILVGLRRLGGEEVAPRFEDLTDAEARDVANAFGIYRWYDRDDLNRQWYELERHMQ
jgi:hypothetical protein